MATKKMIPDVAQDTGLLTIQRVESGKDTTVGYREVVVHVHHTLVDRYEGTVVTEPIWSDKSNIRVVQKAAANDDVRNACAMFFLQRQIRKVITGLIYTNTVKPADVMISKSDLFEAIHRAQPNQAAAAAIMEIVVPYLSKVGILNKNGDYSYRFEYPVGPVNITAITDDVAAFEIVRVMEKTKVVNIADKKYAKEVFADEISDALYEVGRAFLDTNSLASIIDDIVKGVRAHVDLDAVGLTGMTDQSWRDNDVVATLAGNWVFLEAALNLTGTLTPANEGWKLDKYAPSILAAIKSSARYATVGRAEAIRNIGTRKIRNNRGVPISVVLWRSAAPDAVGMSVYAYGDDVLSGAFTLTHTKERLSEVVAAAYGNPAELGTNFAASRLVSTLTDVAQGGFENLAALYQIDIGGYANVENRMVAALCAGRVVVAFDNEGLIVTDERENYIDEESREQVPHIKLWFTVPTTERDMSWGLSGRFDGNSFTTSSVAEVYLALDELTPSGVMEMKPQLYAPIAFNTRIVNFDPRSIRAVSNRFTYTIKVNGADVHGSIRPSDLGSLKSNPRVSLVVPTFNAQVFAAVASTFQTMLDVCKRVARASTNSEDYPEYTGGTGLPAYLERRVARDVLLYAQKIAPAFRAEIHRGILSRATSRLTMDQSIAMRARLSQKAFGAYADVLALSLFVEMQGMGGYAVETSEEGGGTTVKSFWRDIVNDNTMAQVYFETESDRNAID